MLVCECSRGAQRPHSSATAADRRAQEVVYQAIAQKVTNWYRQNRRRPTKAENDTYDEFRRLARVYHKEAAEYNLKAVNLMHQINNCESGRDWDQIDLHRLFVREAVSFVTETLERLENTRNPAVRDRGYLTVVVGKGIHSWRQRPVLGPAIRRLLESKGYEYWGGNSVGFIIVKLQREN